MRSASLLVAVSVVMLGCGGGEEAPAVDTAAMAAAPAPAGLTEADLAGTWTGEAMGMESDSVLFRFTDVCGGGTCRGVIEGTTDTTTSSYRIDGDSVIGSGGPRMDPDLKQNVVESYVLWIRDGAVTGNATIKLAEKDSTVMRVRFRATKAAP